MLSTLGVAAARLTWIAQGHSSRGARRRVADVPVSAATELNSLEAGARERSSTGKFAIARENAATTAHEEPYLAVTNILSVRFTGS